MNGGGYNPMGMGGAPMGMNPMMPGMYATGGYGMPQQPGMYGAPNYGMYNTGYGGQPMAPMGGM